MKNEVFQFGQWQVSPGTNSVAHGDERRQLEPRAMDVLVTLCERGATVVSTEELLEHCWGSTIHGDNPVHKTIAQLRRVLGDKSSAPIYIETIRKRGYRTVAELVYGAATAGVVSSWTGQSPFRGLQAFDEEHAPVFFGRAEATFKLTQTVCAQAQTGLALTLVLGPSGSGKTSLIRAGLLPALMQKGRANSPRILASATFDLGETGIHSPLTALGGAMLDWQAGEQPVFPGASAHALGERLEQDFDSVLRDLQRACGHTPDAPGERRFSLFVDRFEAVFSAQHIAEPERRTFLRVLERLARCGQVLLILACRNDFYPRIAAYPVLMEGKPRAAHFDLGPPTPAEIAQIIRLPALAAGLTFGADPLTQARLDDVLRDSAAASADALPLLQYTLQELYRLRTPEGELAFDVFRQLGGVEGALGERAEQVVNALSATQRACLPRVLSLIVTLSETDDAVSSRRAPWSALRCESELALVNALVETRLFVRELVGDVAGFGVAHDALLRRWPRVTAWIEAHRAVLRVRARLAAQSERWDGEQRPTDLLIPRGKQLSEAQGLLKVAEFTLSGPELALVRASSRKARRREYLQRGALAMIVLLALLSAALGYKAISANQLAQQRRAEAEGLMGFMLGDFADKLRPLARLDLLDSVSAKALEYLSDSSADDTSAASLTQRAKALQVIGEVRIARADRQGATDSLQAAHAILTRQLDAAPDDREVLKNLGVNAFWLGKIKLDQSDWEGAAALFGQYRDYSDRWHALEPDSVDAWIEQSYAHNSLGSLAMKRGDARAAAREFSVSVDLKRRAASRKPADKTLAADLADSLSWVAATKETLGELDAAMALYEDELRVVDGLSKAAPADALWSSRVARALQHRAALLRVLGRDGAALDDLGRARQLLQALLAREPANRVWQWNETLVQFEQLRIEARSRPAGTGAVGLLAVAARMQAFTRLDPKKADWSRLEALARQHAASALLRQGRAAEAAQQIDASLARLRALLAQNDSDVRTREVLAYSYLVKAAIEHAAARPAAATASCTAARDLAAAGIDYSHDFRVLDPWVRAHTCLHQSGLADAARSRLFKMGYREMTYVRSVAQP